MNEIMRSFSAPPSETAFLLCSEDEVDTHDVLKVVLAARRVWNVVRAKVGIQIVHFDRTELNRFRDGDVKAEAVFHREAVVVSAARATSAL